jgi:glycosyltransferase involved in cell wall biosynthesis
MMTQAKEKIAFIKAGDFSHINEMTLEIISQEFPDAEIEVIDVLTELVNNKSLLTFFHSIKSYGMEPSAYPNRIVEKRMFTDYFYNNARKALLQRLSNHKYLFTFQTQSFFDASIPDTPHFLYTDHTMLANLEYPAFDQKNLPPSSWLECEKNIYRNATLNFTMSTNISKSIINDYDCDSTRVVCVHAGASAAVAEDEIFDERRYSSQNILFVGVDWERKGGPVLAEAFKLVLAKCPQATLTIIGCTPNLDIPNCDIVGKVPLADVSAYFKKAAVFCLPTRIEPFGIVFLEAMAHKLPIVATNIGAIPEFVTEGKNGYIVEPDHPQQLADKLIETISSPERCQEFGAYGHQVFWNTYTWQKTGIKLRESIEQYILN